MKKNNYTNIVLPSFATFPTEEKQKRLAKKILKEVLKWTKILLYLFLFSMGLYGCGQSIADFDVSTSTTIGNGLEIGFLPGTTNNPLFDLSQNSNGNWFTFSTFTFDYGPFYALFVWPFAQLLLNFMWATRSWPVGLGALLGIVVILLIIRMITILVSTRSSLASEKMSEVQGKIAEVNARYKDAKDMQSKQRKQAEIQEIYKSKNIKPFAAFEQIFVTLPIFLIVYRVINIVRPLKATVLFDWWDLSKSPVTELFSNFSNGGWHYIFFLALVIPAQFCSSKFPRFLAKKRSRGAKTVGVANNKQLKKTKTIQTVMSVFMAVIVIISATGIGLYWFFNSLLSMLQTWLIHKIIMRKRAKNKDSFSHLTKLGL